VLFGVVILLPTENVQENTLFQNTSSLTVTVVINPKLGQSFTLHYDSPAIVIFFPRGSFSMISVIMLYMFAFTIKFLCELDLFIVYLYSQLHNSAKLVKNMIIFSSSFFLQKYDYIFFLFFFAIDIFCVQSRQPYFPLSLLLRFISTNELDTLIHCYGIRSEHKSTIHCKISMLVF